MKHYFLPHNKSFSSGQNRVVDKFTPRWMFFFYDKEERKKNYFIVVHHNPPPIKKVNEKRADGDGGLILFGRGDREYQ